MEINLFETKYIPTIYLRPAELRAVKELPESAKDILTPIFCLKPWVGSKNLEKAMDKIEDVFGDRPLFLDVDHFYDVTKKVKRPAHAEFIELIDDENDNKRWIDFFEERPNIFPCLRIEHGDMYKIRAQVNAFTKMDRTFLVRINYGEVQNPIAVVDAVCNEVGHTNFGFVVDVGWGRDILTKQVWADTIVKRIVDLREDSIPIIVSGSSFPSSFTGYDLGDDEDLMERHLFTAIQADNNAARLVYGDWASSRSPQEGGGGKPPPRIDLSTQSTWEIYRVLDEDGGFQEAAKEAMQSPNYPKDLSIWATYMIEATKLNDPNGIENSSMRAAAVRINLHLYNQLYFDNMQSAPDPDDDFID